MTGLRPDRRSTPSSATASQATFSPIRGRRNEGAEKNDDKITRQGWIAYAIAPTTVVLDQLSKLWILHGLDLPTKGTIPLLGPLDLTMVWNSRHELWPAQRSRRLGPLAADGVLDRRGRGLSIWARKATKPLMAIGLGMIIGGAIGNNLIDRVIYGAVADFIDVRDLYFPWIFNVADAGISVGVAFLLLDSFLSGEEKLVHPTD
jgi:signal peptidase II